MANGNTSPRLDPEVVAPDILAIKAELPDRIHTRVRKNLRKNWSWQPDIEIVIDDGTALAPRDIEIRRQGDGYRVIAPLSMNRELNGTLLPQRLVPYLLQFRDAPAAERMVVTISDGHLPGAHTFSPSSPYSHITVLPDPYFFRDRGYEEAEAAYHEAPAWDDRKDSLIWRGAPNGIGMLATSPAALGVAGIMPRCQLVLMTLETDIDAGFVFPQKQLHRLYEPQFVAAGMTRPRVDRFAWANQRYALDIDGNSNAWDNFMIRLKLGCCVLKVASREGYRQWYYDRLIPWEHYVPVKTDMSDLFDQYDWVRSNVARSREIAAAGRAVAQAMTLESEWAEGSRLIEANWTD